MAKKKLWTLDTIHKGKSGVYGRFLRNTKTDEVVYIAEKKNRADGIFHETNSLAIDIKTLEEAESRGVRAVIVIIKSTGDKYITTLKKFNSDAAVLNFDKRGGSLQRYLPISEFIERKSEKL